MDYFYIMSLSPETREAYFKGAGIGQRSQYNSWVRRGLRSRSDEAQISKLAKQTSNETNQEQN